MSKLAKGVVITAEGSVTLKYFNDEKPTLEEMQKIVGGHIEFIRFNATETMIVNEEGLLNDLPLNKSAINYLYEYSVDDYQIVGDVLVIDSSLID